MSRLPSGETGTVDREEEIDYECFFSRSADLNVDFMRVKFETTKDSVLQKVLSYVRKGWPSVCKDLEVKPCFIKRCEFSESQDCLFWNHRIVIPRVLQEQLLQELYSSRQGVVKMKSLARAYFWWPGLDRNIEVLTKRCESCNSNKPDPPKVSLHNWPYPQEVWERLHIDFLGPINGKHYLVILDAHSKWPEVFEMSSKCANLTTRALRNTFARFGLPKIIVSDNATCFTSSEFQSFLEKNGIKSVTSPPTDQTDLV